MHRVKKEGITEGLWMPKVLVRALKNFSAQENLKTELSAVLELFSTTSDGKSYL